SLNIPKPPGAGIPLGTVSGGFDIYYSLIWGTRSALRFGLIVTLTTAMFGTLLGAISGYFEGRVNRLIMRITDAFLTIPAIAGVFLFQQIMTPATYDAPLNLFQRTMRTLEFDPIMLGLILFSWMPYTRLINANVATLKTTEYAMAAKTIGAPPRRIILRHLLPNAITPAVVMATRDIGGMVILEATFTFIGIGANLPWGAILVAGRNWVIGPGGNPLHHWWVFIPVTLALILFSIGWNLLGDGINTLLNPWNNGNGRKF
ncbi:MAG: ABC transporter permease, partial [Anaerolineae bacterium]|nr:ABC transporter permease [Anaerolineae bacterium]